MTGSTFTFKGKTYRNLEAQVLENQKKSIKNEEDIKEIKEGGVGNWESGSGENSIQQKGSTAEGTNSLATNDLTFAGVPTISINGDSITGTWTPDPEGRNGYWVKISSPEITEPIKWIVAYRLYADFGPDNWIPIQGPYNPELGIFVPDITEDDIATIEYDTIYDDFLTYIPVGVESEAIATATFGTESIASGNYSMASGGGTLAVGERSSASGSYTKAHGFGSHTEGVHTYTAPEAWFSHAEGGLTKTNGERSHAEGSETTATGFGAHSEGGATYAGGQFAHSEGWDTRAYGDASHSEGRQNTANGDYAHVEGYNNVANGNQSHCEGETCKAAERATHAEGWSCEANGKFSHAENYNSTANGESSHVGGNGSISTQLGSFLHGWELRDSRWYQAVFGLYNEVPSVDRGEQLIVGCGSQAGGRANCFVAGNSNALGGKYIKIGNTVITETQLSNLLNGITEFTTVHFNDVPFTVSLPYNVMNIPRSYQLELVYGPTNNYLTLQERWIEEGGGYNQLTFANSKYTITLNSQSIDSTTYTAQITNN